MPSGIEAVVITKGRGTTLSESAFVTLVPRLSVNRAVKVKVPGCVGVPDTSPALLKDSPAGSEPLATLHE